MLKGVNVWKCRFDKSFANGLENIMIKLSAKIKNVDINNLKTHENINTDSATIYYHYLLSLGSIKTMPTIIIDDKTNVIIDGHHRLYTLKQLNISTVDVLSINYTDDTEFIIVNPNNLDITKKCVIDAGLLECEMMPKTTQHMLCIYGKMYPIIVMSKIISL